MTLKGVREMKVMIILMRVFYYNNKQNKMTALRFGLNEEIIVLEKKVT